MGKDEEEVRVPAREERGWVVLLQGATLPGASPIWVVCMGEQIALYLFSQLSSGSVHEPECEHDLVGRQQRSNALR